MIELRSGESEKPVAKILEANEWWLYPRMWMRDGRLVEPRRILVTIEGDGEEDEEDVEEWLRNYSRKYAKQFSFQEYVAFFLTDGSLECVNPYEVSRINFALSKE